MRARSQRLPVFGGEGIEQLAHPRPSPPAPSIDEGRRRPGLKSSEALAQRAWQVDE